MYYCTSKALYIVISGVFARIHLDDATVATKQWQCAHQSPHTS